MIEPVPFTVIRRVVRNWVQDSTGLEQVVWQSQNAPQPEWPFASIRLLTNTPENQMDFNQYRVEGDDLFIDVIGFRLLTFQVQVTTQSPDAIGFDCDAHALCSAALAGLDLPSVRTEFRSANVAVQDRGAVNDIETLVESSWVSRASVDVVIRAASCVSEEIDSIETVEATVTVSKDDGSERSETITIGGSP